ncbi:ubiquitinyl hydrolase 1 [Entamoeba marina]
MNAFVIPTTLPNVHKTDCMYCPLSLDTKLLETLYVCLNDGQSFCSNCLKKHQTVSSHTHYLVLHQLPSDEPEDPVWGITQQRQLEYWLCDSNNINEKISLETITSPLKEYVNHFISCTAVERKVEMSNQRTSDYTKEIHQIERKTPIDMQHLQCEVEGCGITDNLWLNLIDGINGNSHALKHYDSTHLPLVVKLGTISSDGTADIYDYENDRDVTDPLLKQHLAFFGIDISTLRKTQLSLDEIAKEAALKMERDAIEESNVEHVTCSGPLKTGIRNVGNTCYVASAAQLLLQFLKFPTMLQNQWRTIEGNCTLQLARLACGFVDGIFGMSPVGLKQAVARVQKMYLTGEQQDAEEFLGLLLDLIHQEGFSFIDDQLSIPVSNEINANTTTAQVISNRILSLNLDVPYMALMERKHVDLNMADTLRMFAAPCPIEGYRVNGQLVNATRSTKIKDFPHYLLLKIQRQIPLSYEDVRKVDCDVLGAEQIDIGFMKSSNTSKPLSVDKNHLEMMIAMGFEKTQATSCLISTNNNIEAAVSMITSGQPIPVIQVEDDYNDLVEEMVNMGFDEKVSRKALKATSGDIENAIIMAASGDIMEEEKDETKEKRSGKYECVGFISHIGENVNSGHYVCHVKQEGQWIVFNDSKVYLSQNPPFSRGYLYLYKSLD